MSEADYMDDCQHASRWDEEEVEAQATHEVVDGQNKRVFVGSRVACWTFKRQHGGYVRWRE